MSFSEKLQYNVALPGAEFRNRDLSVPATAAKTIYEIDLGWGANRELCLSILSETFRGENKITEILNESGHLFQKPAPRKAEWHLEVIKAQVARASILERKMSTLTENLKVLEGKLGNLKEKEEEVHQQVAEMNELGEGEVDPQDERARDSPAAPSPYRRALFPSQRKLGVIEKQILTTLGAIAAGEKEFEGYAIELAGYKADPSAEVVSEETEEWGREVVRQGGRGEVKDGGGGCGEWRKLLEKILMALLSVDTPKRAAIKMECKPSNRRVFSGGLVGF